MMSSANRAGQITNSSSSGVSPGACRRMLTAASRNARAKRGFRLPTRPRPGRPDPFALYPVRVPQLEPGFVLSIGLQVEDASGEHLGHRVLEAQVRAEDSLAAQPQQRHSLFPAALAGLAVGDIHDGVAVLVPADLPLETKANQGGTLENELASGHRVGGGQSDYAKKGQEEVSGMHGGIILGVSVIVEIKPAPPSEVEPRENCVLTEEGVDRRLSKWTGQ